MWLKKAIFVVLRNCSLVNIVELVMTKEDDENFESVIECWIFENNLLNVMVK